MKRIRIGNTLRVIWTLHTNGAVTDVDQFDAVTITLKDARSNVIEKAGVSYSNGVVYVKFDGADQNRLGIYTITFKGVKADGAETTIDSGGVFELVPTTAMATIDDSDNDIIVGVVSDSQVGVPGESAYDTWLRIPGNSGKSEDEFLLSLAQADQWYEEFNKYKTENAIMYITQSQYNDLVESGRIEEGVEYNIYEEE